VNVVDANVIEILGPPWEAYNKWFVNVKVSAYGRESETEIMFSTLEEAELCKAGDTTQI
jgi:hypothetical protein